MIVSLKQTSDPSPRWLDTYAAMTATRATTEEQQRLKEIAIARHFEERPE